MLSKVLPGRSSSSKKKRSKRRALASIPNNNKNDRFQEGYEVHASDAISVSSDITNITGFSFSNHFAVGLKKTLSLMRGEHNGRVFLMPNRSSLSSSLSMQAELFLSREDSAVEVSDASSSSLSLSSNGSPPAVEAIAYLKTAWVGELPISSNDGLEPSLQTPSVIINKLEMNGDKKSMRRLV